MDRTVSGDVTTNVQDVTTLTVPVTGDVIRAGGETTVNNVMYLVNNCLDDCFNFIFAR